MNKIPNEAIIKYAYKKIKELEIELGKEKAYNLELEQKIKIMRHGKEQMRQRLTERAKVVNESDMYQVLLKRYRKKEKEVEKLRRDRDSLIFKLNK